MGFAVSEREEMSMRGVMSACPALSPSFVPLYLVSVMGVVIRDSGFRIPLLGLGLGVGCWGLGWIGLGSVGLGWVG